jgi:AraC family transcriptional regulator, regulatory protein of adaptative response / methylated-DNA-[protein]-cysteine methyltransferase
VTLHEDASEKLVRCCASLEDATVRAKSPISLACVDSPLGPLLLGAREESVALLEFCQPDQIEQRIAGLRTRLEGPIQAQLQPVLKRLMEQLDAYFSRSLRTFDVPLTFGGSSFQRQVWSELLRIPYGQTCSYGAIAQRVGDAGAMRAVGAANHHNPIAIVIPCHRVINASGDIGGYGGEVWRKRWLLDLEAGQDQFAF